MQRSSKRKRTRNKADQQDGIKIKNEYAGWEPTTRHDTLDVVDVQSLCWESLFNRYIVKRKPVLIKGHILDTQWQANQPWTNDKLKQVAGKSQIRVEKRKSAQDRYGKGKYTNIDFGRFISLLEEGEELMYMTTQESEDESLLSPPLPDLHERGYFPLRPKLFAGLVPASMNIWMGKSSSGSSSGLHHDYHDNLYILLRGKKKFTLYPPSSAIHMSTSGTITHIHHNGMIDYNSGKNADGSDSYDREKAKVKKMIEEAEIELYRLEKSDCADALIDAAEMKLEKLLELDLDLESRGTSIDHHGEVSPPNFSTLSCEEYALSSTCTHVEAQLEHGYMLYIPTGWFHNVESQSDKNCIHFAFNYWFHPPDGKDHRCPYVSPCWEDLWKYKI